MDLSRIQVASKNVQWTFMGGYLNYMYVFVCGNCLAKTYCFLPSIGQLTMPSFFFCQIHVWNDTNKRMQHTEFIFLPVSKAIKAVSCITDFGLSKEKYLAEHFVRNNCDSAYCNFLNKRLRHGYFSANITKFSGQVLLKHLQEYIILLMSKSEHMLVRIVYNKADEWYIK